MNPTSRSPFVPSRELDLSAEIERALNRAHQQRAVHMSSLFKGLAARMRNRWSRETSRNPDGQRRSSSAIPAKAGIQ